MEDFQPGKKQSFEVAAQIMERPGKATSLDRLFRALVIVRFVVSILLLERC